MRRIRPSHIIATVIVALLIYGIKAGPQIVRQYSGAIRTVHATSSGCAVGSGARISVHFSPKGGCTEACVQAIDNATNNILVQAYSFTSKPIAQALVNAQRRGVKTAVILDKSQRTEKYSEADFVSRAGVKTTIDAVHAIAHNKVLIIDGAVVITGSFNFTTSAEERNAENMLIIRDADLALIYAKNWSEHLQHSEVYAR